MIKKVLIAASAAALMSSPAWALPPQAMGKGHGPTENPGSTHRSTEGTEHAGSKGSKGNSGNHGNHGEKGRSHRCSKVHSRAYIVSGTLISQELTEDKEGGTYSGKLVLTVTHTNHHAATTEKELTVTLEKAHLTLGVEDVNKDGKVNLEDVAAGDNVKLIGKITFLVKKCQNGEFKAETKIRKVIISAPSTTTTTTTTTTSSTTTT